MASCSKGVQAHNNMAALQPLSHPKFFITMLYNFTANRERALSLREKQRVNDVLVSVSLCWER